MSDKEAQSRHQINPGYAFETLEEAKANKSQGQSVITENKDYYYLVRNDEVEYYVSLGYEVVA